MKRLAAFLAIVMILASFTAVYSSAHYDGAKSRYYLTMPKVNSANPGITFDGKVDLANGEWYGALEYVMDYTVDASNTTLDEWTIWSPEVWNAEWFALSSPDELPKEWQVKIYNYYMWDEGGLYIATYYDNVALSGGAITESQYDAFMGNYWHSTVESVDFALPANIQHMIIADSDESLALGDFGKWFYCFAFADSTSAWGEAYTNYSSDSDSNAYIKNIKAAGYQSTTLSDNGGYYCGYEMYIPWSFLCLVNSEGATDEALSFKAAEGAACQVGIIARVRDANNESCPYIQFTDSKGWANFNVYTLGAAAAQYTAAVAETEAPAVEEAAPTESAPTQAPQTADLISATVCAAVVALMGLGIVFKKR